MSFLPAARGRHVFSLCRYFFLQIILLLKPATVSSGRRWNLNLLVCLRHHVTLLFSLGVTVARVILSSFSSVLIHVLLQTPPLHLSPSLLCSSLSPSRHCSSFSPLVYIPFSIFSFPRSLYISPPLSAFTVAFSFFTLHPRSLICSPVCSISPPLLYLLVRFLPSARLYAIATLISPPKHRIEHRPLSIGRSTQTRTISRDIEFAAPLSSR